MSAALRFLHVLSRIHPKAAPNSCSMRETILNPERRPGDQEPCVFPRSRLTFALKAGSKFRKHLRISPTEGPTELKNNTCKVLPKSWAKRLLPFVGGNKNALRGPEPTRWLPPAITRPLLHANTNRGIPVRHDPKVCACIEVDATGAVSSLVPGLTVEYCA